MARDGTAVVMAAVSVVMIIGGGTFVVVVVLLLLLLLVVVVPFAVVAVSVVLLLVLVWLLLRYINASDPTNKFIPRKFHDRYSRGSCTGGIYCAATSSGVDVVIVVEVVVAGVMMEGLCCVVHSFPVRVDVLLLLVATID